jgi:ABC-type polysaccharide/polyol phosphate transport system ATPase subunit
MSFELCLTFELQASSYYVGDFILRAKSHEPRSFTDSKEEFWALKDVSFEITDPLEIFV